MLVNEDLSLWSVWPPVCWHVTVHLCELIFVFASICTSVMTSFPSSCVFLLSVKEIWKLYSLRYQVVGSKTGSIYLLTHIEFNLILAIVSLYWWITSTGVHTIAVDRKNATDSFGSARKQIVNQLRTLAATATYLINLDCHWMLLSVECIDCW